MGNEHNLYKEAGDSLLKSFQYMMDENAKGSTLIYNGLLTGASTVQLNGQEYNIVQYGSFSHSVGDVVKVFVPQGNMNSAFFI